MKRKRFTKKQRLLIYNKCNGRCGYCGEKINIDDFQIDHIIPHRHKRYLFPGDNRSIDDFSNLMPACKVCNHYKGSLTLAKFRNIWLGKLHTRLKKLPKNPKVERSINRKRYVLNVARKYNITETQPFKGTFYFEDIGIGLPYKHDKT